MPGKTVSRLVCTFGITTPTTAGEAMKLQEKMRTNQTLQEVVASIQNGQDATAIQAIRLFHMIENVDTDRPLNPTQIAVANDVVSLLKYNTVAKQSTFNRLSEQTG